jgi:hypothetical protein
MNASQAAHLDSCHESSRSCGRSGHSWLHAAGIQARASRVLCPERVFVSEALTWIHDYLLILLERVIGPSGVGREAILYWSCLASRRYSHGPHNVLRLYIFRHWFI